MKIYHIIEAESWQKKQSENRYIGDSLADQGFIHCCLPEQVDFVVEKWFPGKNDLLILEINSDKLISPLVFENLDGGEEKFPHIYGPINRDAIITSNPYRGIKRKNA